MMNKNVLFWIGLVLPAALCAGISSRLEIHLPRTVQIEEDVIELGRVGIVHGPRELVLQADSVPLGRFSAPGQKITLDRATIESCLAGGGISTRRVRFSGAEQVIVSRNDAKVSGEQLLAAARSYLEVQMAGQDALIEDPAQIPTAWVADGSEPVELVVLPGQNRISGKRTVVVSLRQGGRETGRVPVDFEVLFCTRQAVAAEDIAAGEVVRRERIRFETRKTKESRSADPEGIVGSVARRAIAAGHVIQADWLVPPSPPVLVQRRQKVILRLDTGLMSITASGEAMEEGVVGQVIRVKRGRRPEERIILGTVQPDGTVEPLLGKGI